MRRLTTTAIACLALALVAGCGSDDESDSGTAQSPPPPPAATTATERESESGVSTSAGETIDVSMQNIKFVPENVSAKVGQKIEWKNDDTPPHNVTATDPADLFASDTMNTGDTFEYTPTKAGKIDYVCTIHSGQNGSITVTE